MAYCNATSSAALAAVYPASGGTYVYGRERLGPFWGYLAGWGFVVGKTASCAAMALTVGAYAAPDAGSARSPSPPSSGSPPSTTAASARPPRSPGSSSRSSSPRSRSSSPAPLFGGTASADRFGDLGAGGVAGILQSAGLLFFAFAGYARIATLGEEVVDPARTIPQGDPPRPRHHPRRLRRRRHQRARRRRTRRARRVRRAARHRRARRRPRRARPGRARSAATIAALGVLLSLIAGVSRTAFAMAADRELPGWLDAVHPVHQVPHRAELAVGAIVVAARRRHRPPRRDRLQLVLRPHLLRHRQRLGVDAATRATTLAARLAAAGVVGCATLALTLPAASIIGGACVLVAGALMWLARQYRR